MKKFDDYVFVVKTGGKTYAFPPPPKHRFGSRFKDYMFSVASAIQLLIALKTP